MLVLAWLYRCGLDMATMKTTDDEKNLCMPYIPTVTN